MAKGRRDLSKRRPAEMERRPASLSFPPPTDIGVQLPLTQEAWTGFRWTRSREDTGPARTLHLDQELCFDPSGSLALIFVAGSAEGVHLIDEDDGRLVLPGQLKQVLD